MLYLMEYDIDYRDLALPRDYKKKITTVKEFILSCYFDRKFDHIVHSENPQLNNIVDMLISLGISLEKFDGQMHRINTHIHSSIVSRNIIFEELVNNIDYIKQQNNEIIGKLGQNNSQNILVLLDDIRK